MLPKVSFFYFDTYLCGCLRALCLLRVCLEVAGNLALSLAVPSGQPARPALAFQDLRLSLGSSGGHGHAGDCDQWVGRSPREKFSVGLLAPESREQKMAGLGCLPALEQGGNICLSPHQRSGRQQITWKAEEDR